MAQKSEALEVARYRALQLMEVAVVQLSQKAKEMESYVKIFQSPDTTDKERERILGFAIHHLTENGLNCRVDLMAKAQADLAVLNARED